MLDQKLPLPQQDEGYNLFITLTITLAETETAKEVWC